MFGALGLPVQTDVLNCAWENTSKEINDDIAFLKPFHKTAEETIYYIYLFQSGS